MWIQGQKAPGPGSTTLLQSQVPYGVYFCNFMCRIHNAKMGRKENSKRETTNAAE